jgi:hypothetical protein
MSKNGGPKTAPGKKRSSQNARRHGLFSAACSLSVAEQEEYNKLRSDFQQVLKPNNNLLNYLFEDVVARFWNLRTADGFEQRESKKLFAAENEQSAGEPHRSEESFPYSLKAWQRAQVIKLLDYLRDEVEARRVLPPNLQEPVTQACGAYFWKALAEWAPVDPQQILSFQMGEVMIEKSKVYNLELFPGANVSLSPEYERKYLATDGIKEKAMMCKIIDI